MGPIMVLNSIYLCYHILWQLERQLSSLFKLCSFVILEALEKVQTNFCADHNFSLLPKLDIS